MSKHFFLIILFLVSIAGADEISGSGAFLGIGPSAQSAALGNTMHSVIGSPAALFFNPANLGFTDVGNAYFNASTDQFLGSYNSFGILFPLGQVNIGMGFSSLKIDEIEEYDSDAVYQGSFVSSDVGLLIGIAYFHRKMSWGLSARYVNSSLSLASPEESHTFGLDIGFTSQRFGIMSIPITLGFAASRYFTQRDADFIEEYIPSNAVLGLKSDFSLTAPVQGLENIIFSPVVDLILQKTMPVRLHWGFAINLEPRLFDRTETELKIMLGQRGLFIENGSNITSHEMNDITKRFSLGLGLALFLPKYKLQLDLCQDLANRYDFNRTFLTLGLSW